MINIEENKTDLEKLPKETTLKWRKTYIGYVFYTSFDSLYF